MTPFEIRHEFTGSQLRFWQVYFHTDYTEAVRATAGMAPSQELEFSNRDGRVAGG